MLCPIERLHLADDGSEHAVWMLHYALRMARHLKHARLQILHVTEPGSDLPDTRRAQQATLAASHGVELVLTGLGSSPDVAGALAAHVPTGPADVVIVGFRGHAHGRGLAWGTVGHALLARHDHAVLAMRVVEPGNLGLPGQLAVGLSESRNLDGRLLPIVQLLAGDLDELLLLRVMEVQGSALARMSYAQVDAITHEGRTWLEGIAARLRRALPRPPPIELSASVASDWPSQLVMDAHRGHAHLLLLGASDHLLPSRFTLANPLEAILRNAACDVAVFRAADGPR